MSSKSEAAQVDPLWDDEALATFLGTHPRTPANWRTLGRGPKFYRVGKSIRYAPPDVREWLEARKVGSTSEPARAA
jgi:hypothetical protein